MICNLLFGLNNVSHITFSHVNNYTSTLVNFSLGFDSKLLASGQTNRSEEETGGARRSSRCTGDVEQSGKGMFV